MHLFSYFHPQHPFWSSPTAFVRVPTLSFLLRDPPVFQSRAFIGKQRLFRALRHPSAAVSGWLSPGRDETGRMVVLFTSHLWGLLLWCFGFIFLATVTLELYLPLLETARIQLCETHMEEKIPNQSASICVVWFWFKTWQIFFVFFGQDFKILHYFAQPRITRDGRTLGSLDAPKLMEMISHFV